MPLLCVVSSEIIEDPLDTPPLISDFDIPLLSLVASVSFSTFPPFLSGIAAPISFDSPKDSRNQNAAVGIVNLIAMAVT